MSKLHNDYQATRAPSGLQQRLLDDYAARDAQQRLWLAPALAFVALLVVGVTVLQPETLPDDGVKVGRLDTVPMGQMAALTHQTSSLSRLRISQLQTPKGSALGYMPRMPRMPRSPVRPLRPQD